MSEIRSALENDADTRLADLHVWQVGADEAAAIISLVTHYPRPVEYYRNLVDSFPTLKHVTFEINICEDTPCVPVDLVKIDTMEEAQNQQFLGSPSIQVENVDLWPEKRERYYLVCRVYQTPEGLKGWPTVEMISKKLSAIKPTDTK